MVVPAAEDAGAVGAGKAVAAEAAGAAPVVVPVVVASPAAVVALAVLAGRAAVASLALVAVEPVHKGGCSCRIVAVGDAVHNKPETAPVAVLWAVRQ